MSRPKPGLRFMSTTFSVVSTQTAFPTAREVLTNRLARPAASTHAEADLFELKGRSERHYREVHGGKIRSEFQSSGQNFAVRRSK